MPKSHYADLNFAEREKLLMRAGFLQAEAADLQMSYPWLAPFIFALKELDQSIELEVQKQQQKPVCAKGCNTCCIQPIPVTPPEIMLIKLYLRHADTKQRMVMDTCGSKVSAEGGKAPHAKPCGCVHLTVDGCSIYPVRPIACRRYIVFGKACGIGERVTEVRPKEVLHPSRHALLHVLRSSVPYYAAMGLLPMDAEPDIEFFAATTIIMSAVDWRQV